MQGVGLYGDHLMVLPRTLEPELMDNDYEAISYDAMDHSQVNLQFVQDCIAFLGKPCDVVLDLGTGTAQIPILFCEQSATRIMYAADASAAMLKIALARVKQAKLQQHIRLLLANARDLPFENGELSAIISNSLIHHISEPRVVIQEIDRLAAPGGKIFVRDLARPSSNEEVELIVARYARQESTEAQRLFRESLHAALTVIEIRNLVTEFGYSPDTVIMTSNRHWTWSAVKS